MASRAGNRERGRRRAVPAPLRRARALAVFGLVAALGLDLWAVGLASDPAVAQAPSRAVPAPLPTRPELGWFTSGAPEAQAPWSRDAITPTAATPTVVTRGTGTFTVLPVPASAVRTPPETGRTVRYTVELEGGLGVDAAGYAATVARVLGDPRGWQEKDRVRFVNVTPAQAAAGAAVDLRISLTSPESTDRLCAPLETRGQVSCYADGRAVLNVKRWLMGVPEAYGSDVASYRIYLVNHEVGHALGHGHVSCPGPGQPAPVMMQQSYGLDGCTPWPWVAAKPA